MKRLAAILRWPWWTARSLRRARCDDGQLAAPHPDWTDDELAGLPRVRHRDRRINDQAAEDAAEEGRP